MRALSNALFFTESLHLKIQTQVLAYLEQHRDILEVKRLFPREDSESLFRECPFLPEFEIVNLEIVAKVFVAEVTLIFVDQSDSVVLVPDYRIKRKLAIFKLLENSYSAIFD